MKNLVADIKANKGRYIRRTLIVVGTVAAISAVAYLYTHNVDVDIDVTDLPAD